MWKSHLVTLYRSLARHRLFSALNIFGLAVGMAVFLVLTLAVRFEFSFDRWVPNADRTYRVSGRMFIPGQAKQVIAVIPGPVLPMLRTDFGQIEAGARVATTDVAVKRGDFGDYEKAVLADPSFLDIFPLKFISGDRATALGDTASVVISRRIAQKYLHRANVLGERLTAVVDGVPRDFRISGVMEDLPDNTHLKADILMRLDKAAQPYSAQYIDAWNATNYQTYIRLKPGAEIAALTAAEPDFMRRRAGEAADWMGLRFDRLPDVHFQPSALGAFKAGSDRRFVIMLELIGVLTLALAVINYVNLSTARAVLRSKEVALRKVFGAQRTSLVTQFLVEALVVSGVAGVLAVAMVELALPLVNGALGLHLRFDYFGADGLVPMLLAITAVVGLAAGLYPAFAISRFRPAAVLSASRAPGGGRAAAAVREALVLAQFAISIALLVSTAVVFAQADFVRRSDVGFRRDQLLLVRQVGNSQLWARRNAIQDAFRRVPGVEAVTLSDRVPGYAGAPSSSTRSRPGLKGKAPALGRESIGADYFRTYGARMLAGRPLGPANRMDDINGLKGDELVARGLNVVLNAAAVRELQWDKPSDAIGQIVRRPAEPGVKPGVPLTVVGVVQDIRFGPPREKVPAMLYMFDSSPAADINGDPTIAVRFRGDARAILPQLQAAWRSIAPEAPFKADVADTVMNELHVGEDQNSRLLTLGAVVAVLIGCLGLYGLAAFSSQRRTKEIGVRKVLGASTGDVVRLLLLQFLRPVLAANLIAWPLAWFAMRGWLAGFDQRVALSPAYFLAASALACLIAVATVSGQAWRVARAEPAKALRYE